MATITIGSNSYFSYQTNAQVDTYAEAAIGDAADNWRAETDEDAKSRANVSATRLIDRQVWEGEKYDDDQDGAFPRSGLTDEAGNDVDETTVPQRVLDAHSEIAMALLNGATVESDASTANTIKHQKAGSVEIEYFNAPGTGTRFPLAVMELIGIWFSNSADVEGSEATGTDAESIFDDPLGLNGSF